MNFQKAIDLINESNNILITTHARPDGDACGSMAAIAEALKANNKTIKTLLLSETPQWYEFLFAKKPAVLNQDITIDQLSRNQPDLIIILDTNSKSQLPGLADYLKQNKKSVLVIDHHVTFDGLGDVELIDTSAAAVGLIIYDFFKFTGWRITPKIAAALFTAVATDTGWFHFANADARTFRISAELIDAGANPAALYRSLYQNYSPQRFKLMTVMLDSLQLYFDGRYAEQQLTKADFERTGAKYSDTENLIDHCRLINSVQAAALFVELPDGKIRCSLRSTSTVDVRNIAQKFGGGGHEKAAGTFLPATLANARQLIKDQIEEQFQK
ncbi:MAG: DHH family phosphoesterase [Planctomycetota bacterium]|jgi:phosphoesterase RecJ-like protein